MNNYDDEYFFLIKLDDDRYPFLVPDTNTEDRNFRSESQHPSSPPLVFINGWREENKKQKIASKTPDILFAGADLVVRKSIRDKILEFSIPNLHVHPAIYIDDEEKWHEDFWYVTFTKKFDCWDRDNSDFDQDDPPIRANGKELYLVYAYSLDKNILDKTPLVDRRLFKMDATLKGLIVCHKSMVSIFLDKGAEIVPLNNY